MPVEAGSGAPWVLLTPLGIHHPNGECPNEAICLLIQTLLGTAITIIFPFRLEEHHEKDA